MKKLDLFRYDGFLRRYFLDRTHVGSPLAPSEFLLRWLVLIALVVYLVGQAA